MTKSGNHISYFLILGNPILFPDSEITFYLFPKSYFIENENSLTYE